ncbi:hypothetical protein Bca101_027014 [Brassica carinata]
MPLISVLTLCVLSEGVFVKCKSKSIDLGFDDQPAAEAITSRTMGFNLQT